MYRRFSQSHSRLLITRMAEITDLEKRLSELDIADETGPEANQWRLKTMYHEDSTKRGLLEQLEKGLKEYGTIFPDLSRLYCLKLEW